MTTTPSIDTRSVLAYVDAVAERIDPTVVPVPDKPAAEAFDASMNRPAADASLLRDVLTTLSLETPAPVSIPAGPVTIFVEMPATPDEMPVAVPVVADKPAVAVETPVVAVDKPVVTVEAPVVAVDKPAVAVEMPVVAVDKPAVTVEAPVVAVDKPVVFVEAPVVAADKPAVVVEAPVVAGEKPAVAAEAPVAADMLVSAKPVVSAKPDDDGVAPSAEALVAAGYTPAAAVAPEAAVTKTVTPVAVEAVQRPETIAAVTRGEVLVAAAQAVADAILVSPGLLRGEGEVRIQLRPDVLDGSIVTLNVTGRQLAVTFLPQNADIGTLIEQCRPQLEQHLVAKIHAFRISVNVKKDSRVRI